jgi:hypothetical protein
MGQLEAASRSINTFVLFLVVICMIQGAETLSPELRDEESWVMARHVFVWNALVAGLLIQSEISEAAIRIFTVRTFLFGLLALWLQLCVNHVLNGWVLSGCKLAVAFTLSAALVFLVTGYIAAARGMAIDTSGTLRSRVQRTFKVVGRRPLFTTALGLIGPAILLYRALPDGAEGSTQMLVEQLRQWVIW